MRPLRRILITIVIMLAVVFVGVYRVAPVALSFYAAKKAPAVASVVPTDLKDKSVSQDAGTKLSYFGYQFEVPWTDIDESQLRLYPKDKLEKTKVDLRFHSGLRLVFSVHPPRERVNQIPREFSVSQQDLESAYGRETMKSDYSFAKSLYEFTPDKMNHWDYAQSGLSRDELLLMIKSIALPKAAETGIFCMQNQSYRGFQAGNPRVREDGIVVDLYSDDGAVEMVFFQEDYHNFAGVTQPEINRIVQSLRKVAQNESVTRSVAQR